MSLIVLSIAVSYPVTASQITLISLATIGIPTFVLALEPNESLVRGKFLPNVLAVALPGGLTNLAMVLGAVLVGEKVGISVEEISTIATIIMGVVGLGMLFRVSWPFNLLRKINFGVAAAILIVGSLFFSGLFSMHPLGKQGILMLVLCTVLTPIVLFLFTLLLKRLEKVFASKKKKAKA